MNVLAALGAMQALSAQMLDAARANDLDRLSLLERQQIALRQSFAADTEAAYRSMSAQQRSRAQTLIRETLANDASTREIVEPWLESTRQLLTRSTGRRKLRDSYGAFRQTP